MCAEGDVIPVAQSDRPFFSSRGKLLLAATALATAGVGVLLVAAGKRGGEARGWRALLTATFSSTHSLIDRAVLQAANT